jgi:hypothetical protein
MPLFTVLTPTYNRAHTLHRIYDALAAALDGLMGDQEAARIGGRYGLDRVGAEWERLFAALAP